MLSISHCCENGRPHWKTLETLLLLVGFFGCGFFSFFSFSLLLLLLLVFFFLLPFVLHCFAFCIVNTAEVYLQGM